MAIDPAEPALALDAAAAQGSPAVLILTGTAYAAQPGLNPGTLLFDVWGEDASMRDLAKQVCADKAIPYQLGPIRSAHPLPPDLAAFGREKRALAVDRENENVRAWARSKGIPCFTAKVLAGPVEAPGWMQVAAQVRLWNQRRRSSRSLTVFLKDFLTRLPGQTP